MCLTRKLLLSKNNACAFAIVHVLALQHLNSTHFWVNCPQTVKYVVGKNLKSTGIPLSAWLFASFMTCCRPMVSCWFLYCYMEALDLFKCLLWSYFGKCKQYAPPLSIFKIDEKTLYAVLRCNSSKEIPFPGESLVENK